MLLQHFLENSGQRFPEKTALVSEGQRMSYAELDGMANRIARGLISLGVRRGDRVLICTRDRRETVLSLYGALKAGAVFIVVPDTVRASNIQHLISSTEPGAVLIDPDLLPLLAETGMQDGAPGRIVFTRSPGGEETLTSPSFDHFASLSGKNRTSPGSISTWPAWFLLQGPKVSRKESC